MRLKVIGIRIFTEIIHVPFSSVSFAASGSPSHGFRTPVTAVASTPCPRPRDTRNTTSMWASIVTSSLMPTNSAIKLVPSSCFRFAMQISQHGKPANQLTCTDPATRSANRVPAIEIEPASSAATGTSQHVWVGTRLLLYPHHDSNQVHKSC